MNVIELSAGVYEAPKCVSEWYESLPKKKNSRPDRRSRSSVKYYKYVNDMERLSISAMTSNKLFALMTVNDWVIASNPMG